LVRLIEIRGCYCEALSWSEPPGADMTDLQDKLVLVVEDDYFLAQEISEEISLVGATVIGPAPSWKGLSR
jgi:hypothetical protein